MIDDVEGVKLLIKKIFVSGVLVVACALGAFLIFEHIPEVDPVPANGPIANLKMMDGRSLPFAAGVPNPAGITWMADSKTYLVSTDDRLIVEVTADYSTILSKLTVSSSPLGSGDTEGVAYLGDNRAAVIGENGVVILLQRFVGDWEETNRFPIKGMVAGSQLGSAAYDAATNTLFTAQKTGAKRLYQINLDTHDVKIIDMELSPDLSVADGRNWSEFTIAGLGFVDGKLLANSEAFSSVLTIQTNGLVTGIYGINNINEASGLTVHDGKVILVGDAESYLPDPPIYVVSRAKFD